MTIQTVFEEWRFILELLLADLAFLLPFARPRKHCILRYIAGTLCFLLLSLGYFPLRDLSLTLSFPTQIAILIWYVFLTLLTVPFVYSCFQLTISEALYICTAGYASQHILYTLLHELVVRDLWSSLPSHFPLYLLLTAAASGFLFFSITALFGPSLLRCGGRMFEDRPSLILIHLVLLAALIVCSFSCQHIFQFGENVRYVGVELELLICLMFLTIQYSTLRAVLVGQERSHIEQMLRDAGQQYSLTREMVEHINRTCHDLKHNLQVLKTIDEKERQAYIEQTEHDIDTYHQLVHTDNEVLNTVLASKCLFCESRGIRLSCAVETSHIPPLSLPDLYALLGNAIDNAIECVDQFREPEKRIISLTLRAQGGFLCIQTNNPCETPITMHDGLPITTKENRNSHGFGLKSIRYLAEKYGGSACVSVEDQIFILQILLPL